MAASHARKALQDRTARILDVLEDTHPEAACALSPRDPFQLLAATILSAQCTDQRVNQVTPGLFSRYPTATTMAKAPLEHLEQLIRPTGFFRAKAKSLLGCSRALTEQHQGQVPRTLEALVKLPGTGRKTANVVLSHAFGVAEGIAVDTHVLRVSNRLGIAKGDGAVEVERQLMAAIPRERWARTTDLLIFHGRKICDARRPACGSCPVFHLCQWKHRQAIALGAAGRPAAARKASRAASTGKRSLPKRGRP